MLWVSWLIISTLRRHKVWKISPRSVIVLLINYLSKLLGSRQPNRKRLDSEHLTFSTVFGRCQSELSIGSAGIITGSDKSCLTSRYVERKENLSNLCSRTDSLSKIAVRMHRCGNTRMTGKNLKYINIRYVESLKKG